MITGLSVRPAESRDVSAIEDLLRSLDLPTAGVEDHWRTFIVVHEGDRLVACGGAEVYGPAALLRSIAVDPQHQRNGLGRHTVRQLIDRLASHGIRDFYLLTTTAEEYFAKRGFSRIDRATVPPKLLASEEFRGACPSTAVCMRMEMR